MPTIRILLGIVWFTAFGSSPLPERDLLAIARAEIGVKEATGRNDGKRVEEYLAVVGLGKGHAYCAAFASWVYKQAGYDRPRTGWSPALFPESRRINTPAPGALFGIYFPSMKRVAHCGFVEAVRKDWISTIEANTNLSGARDGDGVHRRTRHIRSIFCYADWRRKEGAK